MILKIFMNVFKINKMKIIFGVEDIKWEIPSQEEFQKQYYGDFSMETTCENTAKFYGEMLDRMSEKFQTDFNKTLENYLRENLKKYNIYFKEDADFYKFIVEKVDKVQFPNGEIRFYFKKDSTKDRYFFGSYFEDTSFDYSKPNTITATYGK